MSTIDPRLSALLAEVRPAVLVLVAIDDDGFLVISGVGDAPIPYVFDGVRLTLDLGGLVAPRDPQDAHEPTS